ncbi:uncharacterized protein E0L32_001616 [Thyridium curvatum]|uniref:Uncharacterized protein n=1 Tax=Thyridium curvatum TaxID=1093900 RepID=A0A507AW29_9PEZI|nr:uncharacterized protein E0L32_001581 [Thyridium curvatum]XP_030990867.1 uncharacterized protein E0L32_001616 [Thyridium curvatum]TPX09121.1 hypothetical protein E0L32_001581 [Thyridium curvatum]TPX09156.1 hypothetical protein E0L32_001616 [Thyridium curvatum]
MRLVLVIFLHLYASLSCCTTTAPPPTTFDSSRNPPRAPVTQSIPPAAPPNFYACFSGSSGPSVLYCEPGRIFTSRDQWAGCYDVDIGWYYYTACSSGSMRGFDGTSTWICPSTAKNCGLREVEVDGGQSTLSEYICAPREKKELKSSEGFIQKADDKYSGLNGARISFGVRDVCIVSLHPKIGPNHNEYVALSHVFEHEPAEYRTEWDAT